MKNYVLIFAMIFCIDEAYSQATVMEQRASNLMKYWKLRGRLIGDDNNKDVYNGLMTVGNGPGMSIPAGNRRPTFGREDYTFKDGGCQNETINGTSVKTKYDVNGNPIIITSNPPNPDIITPNPLIDPRDGKEVKGILTFSDNSLIQIGNYIAVLAVEWALLHREYKSTEQTEKELYYAMMAIERLDYFGETLYSGTASNPSLNGFLARNDVNEFFQLNTSGKNIDLVVSSISCKDGDLPFKDCKHTSVRRPNAMSQDEVIGLLLGFALMKKMMPEYASYNGTPLREWSRAITKRVVNYVKKGGTTNFWNIVDPAIHERVCRGSNAIFNSYAIAATAEYIFGYTQIFQNGWSFTIGKGAWKIMKTMYAMNNTSAIVGFIMPTSMQAALGLDNYENIFIPGNNDWSHDGAYNVSMFLKLLTCSKTAPRPSPPYLDFTGKGLINTVAQTYSKDMYELLGSVMYGYAPVKTELQWRNEFNKLKCGCNCIQGNNPVSYYGCENYYSLPNPGQEPTIPPQEWSVEDRWAFRGHYSGSWSDTYEEYPGLDYMLAFNLYVYKYFANGYSTRVRTNCYNRSFPYLSDPNPYANNTQYLLGSSTYPEKDMAVFSINAWNTNINSSANITFNAGSDIKLLPGFVAKPGSIFHAQIKDYGCKPDVTYFPGGSSYVGLKNGVDSFYDSNFDFNVDSTVSIQLDRDSLDYYNDGPDYDSNMFVLSYTNGIDTFIYDLGPGYIYAEDGSVVKLSSNKYFMDSMMINTINLYPNPANDNSFLEYTLYSERIVRVHIQNELGQEVQQVIQSTPFIQKAGKQKLSLQTSNLTPGIYFCSIQFDNGKKTVKKFTVSH